MFCRVKCVWRVRNEEIQQAWNLICEKRDECDLELSKVSKVCSLFSAISTSKLDSKKKKSRTSDERRETNKLNEESVINPFQISTPGKISQQFCIGSLARLKMVQL